MSLSAGDFEQLQGQLLTLRQELYEARDRETRALKAAEAASNREKEAVEKLQEAQTQAPAQAQASSSASSSFSPSLARMRSKFFPSSSPSSAASSGAAAAAAIANAADAPSSGPEAVAPSSASSASTAATASVPAASPSPSDSGSSPRSPEAPEPWSSSQPLADQVVSLQAELASARTLNEHLIASVQKKDAVIERIQDEGERIMSKLAEKEMQIMTLRESAGNVEETQRELKKRDALVAKLQGQLAAATTAAANASANLTAANADARVAQLSAELRAATDAIALSHGDFDALKEQLENTKDMLFLAETQLVDKQKLLGEQADSIRELRAAAEGHDSTIRSLMSAKEKGEKEMNEHVDYLEAKCLAEVGEWERKYDSDMEEARKREEELRGQMGELRKELESSRSEASALRLELDTVRSEHQELVASSAALSASTAALERDLSELRATALIETRKRNTLVVELKAALKAELIRAKEVVAKLKNAEDDIVTLRVMNQHQIASAASRAAAEAGATGDSAATTNGTGDANGNNHGHADGGPASRTSQSHHGGPVHAASMSNLHVSSQGGGGGGPSLSSPVHSAGVEQEVTVALAQKLAQLQNDKHSLLKKQHSLEEHCEMLQNDVNQKKEMIRNLVRRIETGALSTNDNDGMQKTQMFTALTMEARQALFEKMEIILQETTLQNAQYKNNLQSMGGEITKLMAELDERAAELSAARDELDTARDEQELAQQSADDSLALLRSTETQLKRLERAVLALHAQLQSRGAEVEALAQMEEELAQAVRQVVDNDSRAAAAAGGRSASTSNAAATSTVAAAVAAAHKPEQVAEAKKKHEAEKEASQQRAAAEAETEAKAQAATAAAEATEAAAKAQREEDARLERLQSEAAEAQAAEERRAAEAEARRAEVDASRRAAAEEEEQRRAALLAEADELSAMYGADPASPSIAPPPAGVRQRTASELLADVELSPDALAASPDQDDTAAADADADADAAPDAGANASDAPVAAGGDEAAENDAAESFQEDRSYLNEEN